jgi:hypothetical protein
MASQIERRALVGVRTISLVLILLVVLGAVLVSSGDRLKAITAVADVFSWTFALVDRLWLPAACVALWVIVYFLAKIARILNETRSR